MVDVLISIAIPMKNEEQNVEDWYESVSAVCDEVLVLDTGSSDGTVEKLQALGVCVERSSLFDEKSKPEEFRFDLARNEALGYCIGEWFLVADADERVLVNDPEFRQKLAEIDDSIDMVLCTVRMLNDAGGVTCEFHGERLFRNRPGIKYIEPMHNYVTASHDRRCYRDWITITSCRKQRTPEERQRRAEQRLAMAEYHFLPMIEQNPKDLRSVFYLARTYKESGQWGTAVKWYAEYLNGSPANPGAYQVALEMSRCFLMLGNPGKAMTTMGMYLNCHWQRSEGYCLLGNIAFNQQDYAQAEWWYHLATERAWFTDQTFLEPGAYGFHPWDELSLAQCRQGKYAEAIKSAETALACPGISSSEAERVSANIASFRTGLKAKTKPDGDYYDEIWGQRPDPTHMDQVRMNIMARALDHPKKVLDVGCGPGWLLDELDGCSYLGVDISRVAREKTSARGGYVAKRVVDVSGKDFDGCVLGEVLEHIEDDTGLLEQIKTHLVPGARVVVSVPRLGMMKDPAHVRDYSQAQLEELLKTFGKPVCLGFIGSWIVYKVIFDPSVCGVL